MEPAFEIGHNLPDDPLAALELQFGDILERKCNLLGSFERMPETVENEDAAGKFATQVSLFTACIKDSEHFRVDEKQPHLDAGRRVDGFFKGISDPLDTAKKTILSRLTKYQSVKAETERKEREEAARIAAKEAARLEAAAENDAGLESAIDADARAKEAAVAAEATTADLARTRGEFGAVSSLKTVWTHHVTGTVDLVALRPHFPADAIEKAIKSFVRAGGRELAGVEIYQEHKAVVK